MNELLGNALWFEGKSPLAGRELRPLEIIAFQGVRQPPLAQIRKWQCHQNAFDARVVIDPSNQAERFVGGCLCMKAMQRSGHADLFTALPLATGTLGRQNRVWL
jgi:hypothetical protein